MDPKIEENRPRIVLGRGLGARRRASWRQRRSELEKSWFFGSPGRPKWDPESLKKRFEKAILFTSFWWVVFFGFWIGFGCQNGSQMGALRALFHTLSAICEKYDFEQPSNGFTLFFVSGTLYFRCLEQGFWLFFPNWFLRYIFEGFWRAWSSNLAPKWSP